MTAAACYLFLSLAALFMPTFAFVVSPIQQQQPRPLAPSTTALHAVRFLGAGQEAVVRPGVVLVSPQNEFHHYYRHAAIFVHAMGEDENGVYVVRGVILDHPTPFTLGEMMDNFPKENALGKNLIFRGGDKGTDGVLVLHNRPDLSPVSIGQSGMYEGGWDAAMAAVGQGRAHADDFKFFFNYCEFTEQEIEDLFKSEEGGDKWAAVEVTPDIVLDQDLGRGECWARLRNSIASMM